MPKNYCIMQIWAESGKSALPICNYSQILYQFLTFTQNLKRSPLLLHMLPECLFFFLLFIPLRSFGGGLHLKTYFACFIGSCLILLFTLLSVKYFTIPLFISFVLYAFCAILILIIGPVNHPNRKVNSHDNTIFAKRTYLTIVFTFVIAILFIVTNNAKYMFLQAIVFLFIYATSFIGHILYK